MHIAPNIPNAIKLCFFKFFPLFRYLKYGKAITKADSEPKTNKNVDKNSLPILPAKTGIIYFTSLYLSVITDKIKVLTPNEDIRTITKIKNERIFFPIRKTDGRRKNIIIYQLGVSRKKQDLIILVSTAADSRAAKNRPKVNKNKNMLPKGLDNP